MFIIKVCRYRHASVAAKCQHPAGSTGRPIALCLAQEVEGQPSVDFDLLHSDFSCLLC